MEFLDIVTFYLYALNVWLVGTAFPPYVYAYNRVVLELERWAA